ncbi:TIR domain-containing protein [Aquimarina sp. ERC-38]|uniref:TIR domain-containing protein n=1 Tax=Aquimarina sp. ERC-38 TaxID=2949996 RepID=UPI00224790A9|nr:TIR domain-containing protein [Aquimarina sp. ERC-38]UZO81913.1 TIR domain-containing protein [Aquimarina sp. ERC-38]
MIRNKQFEYDVALSFAGENREYVREVAEILQTKGVRVFYDVFEEDNLWGKNLYEYLSDVYQNKARYTVIFISKYYNKKLWTNHERVAMQARAFQESHEYILPARFDNTEIPGILRTIGYIDLNYKSSHEFAMLIEKKVKKSKLSQSEKSIKTVKRAIQKPFLFTVRLCTIKGVPIRKANVVLIAPNSTYLEGLSDENGYAYFVIRTKNKFTMLVAHSFYKAQTLREVDPVNDSNLILHKDKSGGSFILHKSGLIPGISGKIESIKKRNETIYVTGDNIAISNNYGQTHKTELNKTLLIEDNQGKLIHLAFRFVHAGLALVDYKKIISEHV